MASKSYGTYLFLFLVVIGYTSLLMFNVFDPTISGVLTQLVIMFLFIGPISHMTNTASRHNIDLGEFVHSALFSKMLLMPLIQLILISIGMGLGINFYEWSKQAYGVDSTFVTIIEVIGTFIMLGFLLALKNKVFQILATPIAVAHVSGEKDVFSVDVTRIAIVAITFFSILIDSSNMVIMILDMMGAMIPLAFLFLEKFSFGIRAIKARGEEIRSLLQVALGVSDE